MDLVYYFYRTLLQRKINLDGNGVASCKQLH